MKKTLFLLLAVVTVSVFSCNGGTSDPISSTNTKNDYVFPASEVTKVVRVLKTNSDTIIIESNSTGSFGYLDKSGTYTVIGNVKHSLTTDEANAFTLKWLISDWYISTKKDASKYILNASKNNFKYILNATKDANIYILNEKKDSCELIYKMTYNGNLDPLIKTTIRTYKIIKQ
jgi:hypothetical protein